MELPYYTINGTTCLLRKQHDSSLRNAADLHKGSKIKAVIKAVIKAAIKAEF